MKENIQINHLADQVCRKCGMPEKVEIIYGEFEEKRSKDNEKGSVLSR